MAHPTYQLPPPRHPRPTPAAFADATPSAPTAVRALQLWAPAHGLPPSEKCWPDPGALSQQGSDARESFIPCSKNKTAHRS